MKLIHAADLHLGSRLDSRFSRELAEKRREEVRNSFRRMVDYADREGVRAILLSGDVFDSDKPFKKDKDFFYGVVEKHPAIDFLYLRGNHDKEGDERSFDNLKTFSHEWRSYAYGELVVSGIEITKDNATSLYSSLALDGNKTNIVMLHGQAENTFGVDRVNLAKLRDKGIDYLALGHIHSFGEISLDKRGVAVYSGCLEGRGFDETGEKGFVLLDTEGGFRYEFVPFSKSPIEKLSVDVSGLSSLYDMYLLVKKQLKNKNGIYRIELVGEIDLTVDVAIGDLERNLSDDCAYVSVKDKTGRVFDIHRYDGDLSLKGEFVRLVFASQEYTDEEKAKIALFGLKALDKEEVPL